LHEPVDGMPAKLAQRGLALWIWVSGGAINPPSVC
jgi:hypothetical protein